MSSAITGRIAKRLGRFDAIRLRFRYDDGCTGITNIDFSKGVIKEMMLKNLRKRPRMKWQVMDMTETKARVLTHCKSRASLLGRL